MKLTIVEKNLLSWTAMHIDFVMCRNRGEAVLRKHLRTFARIPNKQYHTENQGLRGGTIF